jgi:ABC-type lipoprotein release transport system permease subunit
MAAITRWCWLDVRRRWRSLLVLALLIAFAAATVMTAVAGARRGVTAVDRLVEQTLPATVLVLPNTGGFDWSAVRDLPEVAALSVWPLTQVAIDGLPPDEFAEVYDEEAMRTLERPVVLEGRLPDPQQPDEPAPGIDVDGAVLAAGVVGVPLLVVVAALAAAALTLHRSTGGSAEAPRQSRVVAAAAGAGLPVSAVVGARFAFEPSRGPQSLPVRPALLGSIVGVAGALAALTFSAGVDDATRNLERFGVVHDLELFIGMDGTDYFPADDILTAVASVEGVAGVNDTRSAVADTGNGQLAVLSVDPVGDPLEFVVSEGRLPYAGGELTIGPASARSLGVGVGDTIELTGTTGTATVTVVGIGLMPQLAHNFYTDGGLVTAGTYDGLFDGFRFRAGFIGLAPGADPIAVVPAVQQAAAEVPGGEIASVSPAQEPSQAIELQQVRVLPAVLAGFLALLALGAVGHALATAVRRRRHDLAVLRALGMTRAQSRWVVVTQASMLAVVGALVGLPLGVALGRTIWRYVAETTPLLYVPPVALIALLVVVPVAFVAANALAAWPGHRAASLRVAQVLRTE